ncbi:hypothetical protein ABZT47_30500 [Sphaerisporangium sp. NPDC005289]|uniref:hypothetical protein n=1 Tax=Sphaerisporangium sp. NPDC005289 TaxID=3155247 RepID=UPI0033A67D8C
MCSAAIRLVRRAERAGLPCEDIRQAMLDDARAEGLPEWELYALHTLLADSIVLGHDGRWPAFAHASYTNGQHRSQAMIEAGVRRTITLDWTSR